MFPLHINKTTFIFNLSFSKRVFSYLFTKNKEGRWVLHVLAAERTVHRRLVDEGVAPLSGEDLPLLLVVAHVGVHAEGQQGDDDIQIVVRPGVIEHLCQQALCEGGGGGDQIHDYLHTACKLKRVRIGSSSTLFSQIA